MSELDIFDIERFAIHDGEGIRTAVFFQGCPLKCKWCANPESQSVGRKILFFGNKCVGCGGCAKACPRGVVSIINGKSVFDRAKCISCGKCAGICPRSAIKVSGRKISCEELFEIVIRDKAYYDASSGGVTLSGGEALLQIDKLLPFLAKCKGAGVNIAFETCGYVSVSSLFAADHFADSFLFDIKTLSAEKYKAYTGGELEKYMYALDALCRVSVNKITARIPVIPQFNDDEIPDILRFIADNGIKEAHLLPYHTLGVEKYAALGREYELKNIQALGAQELEKYQPLGKELGLKIKIGG